MLEGDWMGLGALIALGGAVAMRIAVVRIADPDPERSNESTVTMKKAGFCALVIGACVTVAAGFARCGG